VRRTPTALLKTRRKGAQYRRDRSADCLVNAKLDIDNRHV
jgi:hypothetical protein